MPKHLEFIQQLLIQEQMLLYVKFKLSKIQMTLQMLIFQEKFVFVIIIFISFATTESATLPVEQRTRAELLFRHHYRNKRKKRTGIGSLFECGRRESNPYASRHQILSLACLPISTRPRRYLNEKADFHLLFLVAGGGLEPPASGL